MINVQGVYKFRACSVQCLIWSMKYTGAVAGTFKGTEHSVQFSVCCVLPATGEDLEVETGQVKKKLEKPIALVHFW